LLPANLEFKQERSLGQLVQCCPKVSVLVLTFNHEHYIRPCLESILQSAIPNMHIWVLDDGSRDGTQNEIEIIARSDDRITFLTQPNSGGLTAKNTQRLLDESSGEYVLFMSGDDMLGPNYPIARTVATLDADSQLGLVLPRLLHLMEDPGRFSPHIYKESFLSALRSGSPHNVLQRHLYKEVSRLFLQGVIVRRSLIEGAGGFDTSLLADDYAFQLRLFQHLDANGLNFWFDDQSLWLYRVHDSNVHRIALRQFKLILEVVHKYVPERYWPEFLWDAVAFSTLEELRQGRDEARRLLGRKNTNQLIRRIEHSTLKSALNNGDVGLLRAAATDSEINLLQRIRALRYLVRIIFSG
jgi:glycosyltransferase involved in cell wall biosynthesis